MEIWRIPYSWTRNYRLPIRPQYNLFVYRAPFRCWKLLPVSVKSKVLKFHVHSVHKLFCIGSTGAHRQTGVVERITTRHTDVIECITNIDTQTWSKALHVLILLFYLADGSILFFYAVDVSNVLELLFYVAHVSILSTSHYWRKSMEGKTQGQGHASWLVEKPQDLF